MPTIDELTFSDLYITPSGHILTHDLRSSHGLMALENITDFKEFHQALHAAWKGKSSYSMVYNNYSYRVERVLTMRGIQYTARRMPVAIPDIHKLGYMENLIAHLTSMSKATGLLLWAGATSSGKTTAASCILKSFLDNEGGVAYTIEDPPELPLDGIWRAKNGTLALCSQTEPALDDWAESLKSALRSHPRYILVGEIRSPEAASELLRASISGHLVMSTIHANNVADALQSVIKYASAADLSEELAATMLGRSLLGVVFQNLVRGQGKIRPEVSFAFANPNKDDGDQLRSCVCDQQFALGTIIESQMARLLQGKKLFAQ